ncbi:MAG: proteasome subunit alpha [Propionibacteriaceae bacterium]|nr:proteasome subunit alpha [Propionibacteriaceae bacterium]
MSAPMFYVSPEQQVKDRAEFARAGIARGRSVIVQRYRDGILFVAENHSQSLHKVSEIYDRIGFAAVGRYNEFDNLRIAGIRHADIRGYAYDRRDVTGRMLANAYAQVLGTIFSAVTEKPYEVELAVAEVGRTAEQDQIFRLTFDGSIADERDFCVMGGAAEQISASLAETFTVASLPQALATAVRALAADPEQETAVGVEALEAAVLDRTRHQSRKFTRLSRAQLAAALEPVQPAPARSPRRRANRPSAAPDAAPVQHG